MTYSSAPVGVFDSGVGGLTVTGAIRRLLPDEALLYCSDQRFSPYGAATDAFVTDRTLAIGRWLVAQGAKAVVVACNTATTIAIEPLRAALDVPVIGVEPGVKPAASASRSGVAGVLATAATLRSASFQRLVREHAGACRIVGVAGIGLVEAIEAGDLDSPALREKLRDYLRPIVEAGADTLALGCTHYPFLVPLIEQLAGDTLRIVDNGAPVARQLARRLAEHGLRAPATASRAAAPLRLVCTGDTRALDWLARNAFADEVPPARTVTISSPLTDS